MHKQKHQYVQIDSECSSCPSQQMSRFHFQMALFEKIFIVNKSQLIYFEYQWLIIFMRFSYHHSTSYHIIILFQECTMSEIESRLYDKFNITVSEVKVLLADSGKWMNSWMDTLNCIKNDTKYIDKIEAAIYSFVLLNLIIMWNIVL